MTRRDAIIFLAGSGVTALMVYLFANITSPPSHPSQSTTSTTTVRGGGGVGSMPAMNIIGTGALDTRELTQSLTRSEPVTPFAMVDLD